MKRLRCKKAKGEIGRVLRHFALFVAFGLLSPVLSPACPHLLLGSAAATFYERDKIHIKPGYRRERE